MDNMEFGLYSEKDVEKFQDKVIEYLKEHPGKNEREISIATGVPRMIIKKLIKEGIIIIKDLALEIEDPKIQAENRRERLRNNFIKDLKVYNEEMAKRNPNSQLVNDLNNRKNMEKESKVKS